MSNVESEIEAVARELTNAAATVGIRAAVAAMAPEPSSSSGAEAASVVRDALDLETVLEGSEVVDDAEARLTEVLSAVLAPRFADAQPAGADARDAFDAAGEAFARSLRDLLGGEAPHDLDVEHAARAAAARHLWERRIGEVVSPERFGALVGVSRQRIQHLCTEGRLLALRDRRGRWRIPAWQADLTGAGRVGVARAAALFEAQGVSGWSAASWLATGHPELGGRAPRDLADEDQDRLLAVATRDAVR